MKKKFYVIVLKEKNGEYEYRHTFVSQLNSKKSAEKHADNIAKHFYNDKAIEESGYYLFHSDGIAVRVEDVTEIPETEFFILKKYVATV